MLNLESECSVYNFIAISPRVIGITCCSPWYNLSYELFFFGGGGGEGGKGS